MKQEKEKQICPLFCLQHLRKFHSQTIVGKEIEHTCRSNYFNHGFSIKDKSWYPFAIY